MSIYATADSIEPLDPRLQALYDQGMQITRVGAFHLRTFCSKCDWSKEANSRDPFHTGPDVCPACGNDNPDRKFMGTSLARRVADSWPVKKIRVVKYKVPTGNKLFRRWRRGWYWEDERMRLVGDVCTG